MKKKLRNLFKRNIFKIEDVSYLCKLLETNMPLKDSLNLIKTDSNKHIVDKIITKLDDGQLIESFITDYLPKQIRPYVASLLSGVSFSEAISISCEFYEEYEQNHSKIISDIAYPCILLFVSISAMYLFDLYGMDTLFATISSFNVEYEIYDGMRLIFRIVINVIYYLFIICCFLLFYYIQPKRVRILYIVLSKYRPDSIINLYLSQEFISLFLICSKRGYKSKQTLDILKSMKHKPLISFLAYHLDDSLMSGELMNVAVQKKYYDSSLSRFIKIASYTNDFSIILDVYVRLVKEKIKNRLKKYTLTLQLTTYLFIGIIVVFIYQILFIPMQAISNY